MVTQVEKFTIEKPYLKGISRQLYCIFEQLDRIEKCMNPSDGDDDDIYLRLQAALPDADCWIVWGRVRDTNKKGIGGLRICLFDRDLKTDDDRLGSTYTNSSGEFLIVYKTAQFEQAFGNSRENYPDLYLIGRDKEKIVFIYEHPVRWRVDHLERFCIDLNNEQGNSIE